MKKVLLFVTLISVLIRFQAAAQDKIFKTNGEILKVKVVMVGESTINFVYTDNPNGPQYSIAKSDVGKIQYKNGSEDYFNFPVEKKKEDKQISTHPAPKKLKDVEDDNEKSILIKTEEYKPKNKIFDTNTRLSNILSFSPFLFTECGIGMSLCYERKLDKDGIFSLNLPIVFTLNNTDTNAVKEHSDPIIYFMPGIKVYTRRNFGKFVYAIGPSFVFATGQNTQHYYDNNYGFHRQAYSHNMFGVAATNSLNIFATKRVYIGFDAAIGYCFLNMIGGTNETFTGLINGSFKMGVLF